MTKSDFKTLKLEARLAGKNDVFDEVKELFENFCRDKGLFGNNLPTDKELNELKNAYYTGFLSALKKLQKA